MTNTSRTFAAAERFVVSSARLLERARFAAEFADCAPASKQRVLAALAPYQNEDGGFGQVLEPDFRGPVSQPLCVDQAFHIVDELALPELWSSPLVTRALDYLTSIQAQDGGVPNVLPSAGDYERAPWWQPDPAQPGSLLPTASLLGRLYKHRVACSFRERASVFCWQALERLPARITSSQDRLPLLQALYETRAALLFLQHVPERQRAERTAATLGRSIQEKGVFDRARTSEQELAEPLDFASTPDSLARAWFSDRTIHDALDGLRRAQQEDGGFPISWAAWHSLAALEWRGIVTLERLKTLRAYDALS